MSSAIAAGQTETESGIIRDGLDLGTAAMLIEPAGGWLSIFGPITGPASGTATLAVAAGATLYAAGMVGASVVESFAGAGGTLDLADLYLPEMAAAIAGFVTGEVIDIISGTITDASIAAGPAGSSLILADEGTPAATLALADTLALGDSVFAIPDGIDGTRIVLGNAMPTVAAAAPAGSSGGASFAWAGGGGGQWANAAAWRSGGAVAATAPGARDSVTVAGTQDSVLSLAGNGAAASLTTQGLIALAGGFALGRLLVGAGSQDALVLNAGCDVTAATATLAAGVLQIASAGATLDLTGSGTVEQGLLWVADGGLFEAPSLLLAGGTVRIGGAGTVAVGSGAGAGGVADVAGGGLLAGFGTVRAPVSNDGTVRASGGVLALYGPLTGNGLDQIEAGATLYLPQGADAQQQIGFEPGASGGTLELFASASGCAATITGFGVGDVIDIASSTLSQAAWTPPQPGEGSIGVLDLGSGGTLDVGLASGVDPSRIRFSVAADGLGGSAIALVPCFCEGTLLAAPGGPVAVEDVAVGDRLLTRGGAARRVRWIGRRSYDAAVLRRESQLRPVRIVAGALGAGAPLRDLRLSPQHALALPTPGGLRLVPAVALVDGRSIRREEGESGVTYIHIELDSHDLLLAEGVAAESFLAEGTERRSLFQQALGNPAGAAAGAVCPRLDTGPVLAGLRRKLGLDAGTGRDWPATRLRGTLERAEGGPGGWVVEGWALTGRREEPASLDLMLGGIVCGKVVADLWRPDLDRAGLRGGACGFRCGRALLRGARRDRPAQRPPGAQFSARARLPVTGTGSWETGDAHPGPRGGRETRPDCPPVTPHRRPGRQTRREPVRHRGWTRGRPTPSRAPRTPGSDLRDILRPPKDGRPAGGFAVPSPATSPAGFPLAAQPHCALPYPPDLPRDRGNAGSSGGLRRLC